MQKIVLASDNAGKLREFQALLTAVNLAPIAQKVLGVSAIPETATTFIENALIKARHASQQTGLAALADDSGLVVEALQGAPGIYSARYAGEGATASAHMAKLLHDLQGVPQEQRHAHFYCILVYLRHAADPAPLICQGRWDGLISDKPVGEQGFGYDPLFYVPSLGCSAAQLTSEVKNSLSHRAQACKMLLEQLTKS